MKKVIFTILISCFTIGLIHSQCANNTGANATAQCTPFNLAGLCIGPLVVGNCAYVGTQLPGICLYTCNSFPVEFLDMNFKMEGANVELTWSTASEENNEGFFIERSFDGNQYERIAKINGAGTSSEINSYSYKDISVQSKASSNQAYYRLVQIDFDGRQEILPALAVKLVSKERFAINNVISSSNSVSVYFESALEDETTITIHDISGKVLGRSVYIANEGFNMSEIQVENAPTGLYLVSITNGKEVVTQKFLN